MKKQERRHAAIIDLIDRNQFILVDDLCQSLNVSPATVRRDLTLLADSGIIRRVNGGAMMQKQQEDVRVPVPNQEPAVRFWEEKKRIAEEAVSLVNEGDTIFMDGGTTNLEIANKLTAFSNITIVTTSIEIAFKFSRRSDISIFVCGGIMSEVNPQVSIIGPLAKEMISYFRASICFLGTSGLHVKNGVTDLYLASAEIKNLMIQNSAKSILVADHSKFGKIYTAFVCPIEQFDLMITDRLAPKEDVDILLSKGVPVKLV